MVTGPVEVACKKKFTNSGLILEMSSIMRLSEDYQRHIKQITKQVFGEKSRVFLFGSRVNDTELGGDIDLYIIPQKKGNIFKTRIEFLVKLKKRLGDQKIDVVVAKDENRAIEKEALITGVEL